jgi:predicted GNAT family N-acyltransferase
MIIKCGHGAKIANLTPLLNQLIVLMMNKIITSTKLDKNYINNPNVETKVFINNKIYSINYIICSEHIHVNTFMIKPIYRGRGYSRRIIYNIRYKYNLPIVLECFPTLFDYYKHSGFVEIGNTYDGYIEMILK